jgi:hypothetical protein
VLFADAFERTARGLGDAWSTSGLWKTQLGRAETNLNGPNRAAARDVACADCRVEARVLGFGVPEVVLFLRAPTATNGTDRYEAALLGTGRVAIRRVRAGVTTQLADAPAGVSLRRFATLALEARGDGPVALTLSVNGAPLVAATDASAQAIAAAGHAGMASARAGVWFDDFRLTGAAAEEEEPPPPPPPPPPPSPTPGTVLYADAFARTDAVTLGPDWTVLAGDWFTRGFAESDRDSPNVALALPSRAGDARVEVTVTWFGVEAGVAVRAQPGGERYECVVLPGGAMRIRRVLGGATAVLGSASGAVAGTSAFRLGCEVRGAGPVTVTALASGAEKLTVSDAAPGVLAGAGLGGMVTPWAGVWFDDFVVRVP